MSNWFGRFTILTLVGALLCSALVVGCSSGDEGGEEGGGATNTTGNTTTP